ncbi:MAG: HAD family phosphatase [Planctomycetes bacterium]|nr:HAD family phosphatase [Planctomycetota bacterium]
MPATRWRFDSEGGRSYVTVHTPVETRYAIADVPARFPDLEAVMMDMDGSSTDTEKLVLEAMRRMMASALGEPSFAFAREDYPHIIGDSTTNHVRYLVARYGLAAAALDEAIEAYYAEYHRTLRDIRDGRIGDRLIEPMPGLPEFLSTCKRRGIRVGLVTSSLREEVDIIMPEVFGRMGIAERFERFYDGVIAADEVGEAFLKPHPNLYVRMAEEKLRIRNRRRAFVIEDSTAGIIAGRIAGFAVVAVPHPGTRDHDVTLANLGLAEGGLPEILGRDLFR